MNTTAYKQFICRACGLIYDEALGDEDSGLAPGTRFQDIPDDWACPLCGVTKADFEPHDAQPQPQARLRAVGAGSASRGRGPIVIVGGGTAAWTVIERIRALEPERPITMVAACSADRYDKPRLSVAFRQGVAPEALVLESGAAAASRWGVRLMAQTQAVGVDPRRRRLRTTRGVIEYGELVLAHGAQTRSCPGLPDDLTWRINDLAGYRRLRDALEAVGRGPRAQPASVLLVGAGLVGCELANDLALAGYPVTLIESADRPLPMASVEQSRELLAAWSALPIRFIGQRQVRGAVRIAGSDQIRLELQGGAVLTGDALISAVGLVTPTRLATQAGLNWDHGIAVDAHDLSTGVANVHAVGDCISIGGQPQRFIEPIRRQAAVVAARLCGRPIPAFDAGLPPVRVKTSSKPFTLARSAA